MGPLRSSFLGLPYRIIRRSYLYRGLYGYRVKGRSAACRQNIREAGDLSNCSVLGVFIECLIALNPKP